MSASVRMRATSSAVFLISVDDPDRIGRVLDGADDRERRQLAGARVFARDVFDPDDEPAELPFHVDLVAVALELRDGDDPDARPVRADPGEAHGGGDVDVGGKAAAGLARRAGKKLALLFQSREGKPARGR